MKPRYAIYFTPAHGSPWWQWGAHWLGRDERDNLLLEQPALTAITPQTLRQWTEYPRRYGFHATLKAPFSLADRCTRETLEARIRILAKTLKSVPLGPLRAVPMDGFVALAPHSATDALMALAAACVTSLDDLRAPLTSADLSRRRPEQLDPRALELLQTYGYPMVLERFQLHFTLGAPLTEEMAQTVASAVEAPVEILNATCPMVLDRLCLFVEPFPGASFERIADMELLA